jgi:tyrosyl-tRNA synthetase
VLRASKKFWIDTFQKGGVPEDIQELVTKEGEEMGNVLVKASIVSSKTDWRRLVDDKAVTDADGNIITNTKELVKNVTLKIGKKRFVKIVVG